MFTTLQLINVTGNSSTHLCVWPEPAEVLLPAMLQIIATLQGTHTLKLHQRSCCPTYPGLTYVNVVPFIQLILTTL
jgi:hypothetical protein